MKKQDSDEYYANQVLTKILQQKLAARDVAAFGNEKRYECLRRVCDQILEAFENRTIRRWFTATTRVIKDEPRFGLKSADRLLVKSLDNAGVTKDVRQAGRKLWQEKTDIYKVLSKFV